MEVFVILNPRRKTADVIKMSVVLKTVAKFSKTDVWKPAARAIKSLFSTYVLLSTND